MRREVSPPQSRFSALTREQMVVFEYNNADQREGETECEPVRGCWKFFTTPYPPTQIDFLILWTKSVYALESCKQTGTAYCQNTHSSFHSCISVSIRLHWHSVEPGQIAGQLGESSGSNGFVGYKSNTKGYVSWAIIWFSKCEHRYTNTHILGVETLFLIHPTSSTLYYNQKLPIYVLYKSWWFIASPL